MNNGVTFDQALKMKIMIKMDVVTLLNGRFIEITEVYNIFINGKSNADYDINTVRHELMHDMKELISEGMYMKALKRQYSLYNIEGKTKMKEGLLQYFSSPIGLLNRAKSDLETMLSVIESKKFDLDEIRNSLQMLKEIVSSFPVENNIEQISLIKTKEKMKGPIYKQILRLKEYINRDAEKILRQIS